MAVTGSGTEQDPYIVTTWQELVDTAKVNDDRYIELGNDIVVTDEFPTGDAPTLQTMPNVKIDGKFHQIRNCYFNRADRQFIVVNNASSNTHTGYIKNTDFANIYIGDNYNQQFAIAMWNNPSGNTYIRSCSFWGYSKVTFAGTIEQQYTGWDLFFNCGFAIQTPAEYWLHKVILTNCNCYVKYLNNNGKVTNNDTRYVNCMVEMLGVNGMGLSTRFDNSALKLHTTSELTVSSSLNNNLNIFNLGDAPNSTAGNKFVAVPDDKWLDIPYLQSIGFDIA